MIGFDIGGTKCAVSVGYEENGALVIQDKRVIPTDTSISPYDMIEKMCVLAEEITTVTEDDVIGISCGGPLNSRTGVIMSPPNLPGWDNVAIVDYLKKRFGCKSYLQNDANACAVAEWLYGAGKGMDNMIFLTFGTGLGAGLILDGKLYCGASDMAGEVGHMRLSEYGPIGYGKTGSFEGFCSGGGIAQLGKIYATQALQTGGSVSYCKSSEELSLITAKMLAEYANKGDKDALFVFEECAKKLGFGLSLLIDVLNPDGIVIGSIYTRCENLLKEKTEEVIKKEVLPAAGAVCKILPAALGEKIGDYAALSVAAMGMN